MNSTVIPAQAGTSQRRQSVTASFISQTARDNRCMALYCE